MLLSRPDVVHPDYAASRNGLPKQITLPFAKKPCTTITQRHTTSSVIIKHRQRQPSPSTLPHIDSNNPTSQLRRHQPSTALRNIFNHRQNFPTSSTDDKIPKVHLKLTVLSRTSDIDSYNHRCSPCHQQPHPHAVKSYKRGTQETLKGKQKIGVEQAIWCKHRARV